MTYEIRYILLLKEALGLSPWLKYGTLKSGDNLAVNVEFLLYLGRGAIFPRLQTLGAGSGERLILALFVLRGEIPGELGKSGLLITQ